MSKYELDLDYIIPVVDISQKELEDIVAEADIIIEKNGEPEELAIAYLKKAQAMQKIYEGIVHGRLSERADFLDSFLESDTHCDKKDQIKELAHKALKLSPNMPQAIMQLGKVYHYLEIPEANDYDEKKHFFDEAIKMYTKAIELKPDYAAAYNYRGNIYSAGVRFSRPYERKNVFRTEELTEEKKDYDYGCYTDEAIADYTEAIRLRPFDATYYFNRGQTIRDRWGLFLEAKKVIPDYSNAITYGSDNFKNITKIYQRRGREYFSKKEKEKARCDFSECFANLEGIIENLSLNLPPIITTNVNDMVTCFICNNSFGDSIGSNRLKICKNCLKKLDADMLSVLSITEEDVEKYRQERKNEEEERIRLPKIITKTISKNKKIRHLEQDGELLSTWEINRLLSNGIPKTGIPKDGMAARHLPEDKTCFICRRNCYVTRALFMMRDKLWICPDCIKYIDINDENISSLSITDEETTECRTYLDANTPEGKEAHSILNEGGSTTATGRRIISWNSHYGFDSTKAEAIKPYNASILVIPECREMDMETSGYDAQHRYWYGDHKEATDGHGNINKEKDLGIGVFWKDEITVTPLTQWGNTLCTNNDFRYLVPFRVHLDYYAKSFTLIAVWTKGKNAGTNDTLEYVEKAHAALDRYEKMGLLDDRVVIIGDFNSNAIWDDRYPKDKNHTALVEKLRAKGIVSAGLGDASDTIDLATPERRTNFQDGLRRAEQHTYCYYKNGEEKQVIDDYCFASEDMIKGAYFSVPDASDWKEENGVKRWNGSDHFPICVEMDIKI